MYKCPECHHEISQLKIYFRPGNYDIVCRRCGYKMQVIKSPNPKIISLLSVALFLFLLISIILPAGNYEKLVQAISFFISLSILFYINIKNTKIL